LFDLLAELKQESQLNPLGSLWDGHKKWSFLQNFFLSETSFVMLSKGLIQAVCEFGKSAPQTQS
jgi:hypothetical protein